MITKKIHISYSIARCGTKNAIYFTDKIDEVTCGLCKAFLDKLKTR